MKNLFNLFSKRYEITRFNSFLYEGDGKYLEKVNEESYRFLESCCNNGLGSLEEVVSVLDREGIDEMSVKHSSITGFIWSCSKFGSLTSSHKLSSLKSLMICVDEDKEFDVDLSGFPQLKSVTLFGNKFTIAPKPYLRTKFPNIVWGSVPIHKLSISEFDIASFDATKLSQLKSLDIFETEITRLDQLILPDNSKVGNIYLNDKEFDSADLNRTLDV